MYKNDENLLAVDKVIARISRLTFLAHPVNKKHYRLTLTTNRSNGVRA